MTIHHIDVAQGDATLIEFQTAAILIDAGGLTVWKNYETVLVSDAGGSFWSEDKPWYNWLSHSYRTLETIDNQVRSLRKRQVVDSYKAKVRLRSFWSIRGNIMDYAVTPMLDCPIESEVAKYKYEQNSIAQFLEERTETGDSSRPKPYSFSIG